MPRRQSPSSPATAADIEPKVMLQIVLLRPGTTDYDQQGRIQGTLDIPLCDKGSEEVRRVAAELRTLDISVVYGSSCRSAWETASAVAEQLGVKVKKLDNAQNLDHGLWQGMLVDDVKRRQPKVYRQWQEQPEIICPPEGEMLGQASERIQTVLWKLVKKHRTGTILMVLPEPLLTLAHSFLSNTELGDLWKAGAICATWELLTVEPQRLAPTPH